MGKGLGHIAELRLFPGMDLIFIHGPPAAGKLTVGKALAALTGYPLFHNHLVVNAVAAVFPFGSGSFVRLRQDFWLEVFELAAREGRSVIFTFAPEGTVPADFLPLTVARVTKAGGCVRFIELTVSEAEQERRIGGEDRVRAQKLTSVELLRRIRQTEPDRPPADLTINTDQTAPSDSAQQIVKAFGLVPLAVAHKPFPD